jgi:hypothetical protein
LDLRNNIFFRIGGATVGENATAQLLFTDLLRSNSVVDPQLRSISRTNNNRLDPRPSAASAALVNIRTAPADGFFSAVAFKGAFAPNELWITGWTFLDKKGFLPGQGTRTMQVSGNISGNVTWFRTNDYVLNGFVYVLDGAALTIEPGTVIRGKTGQDANTSALIVTRGGKIFANGTAHNPIIFTAEADDVTDPDDLGIYQRGLWGGVVLLGKARLNTTVDVSGNAATPKYEVFEGLPDAQVNGQFVNRFGGSNDDDSSGVMRYVSIRHAGVVFQPNKELNGLSLGAVGRGTTLEFVETYATADDGFEFFGGTVNTKYLVSAFNDDDAFDVDMGYRGKNQFWFAIQEPGKKDNGGEWNGEPSGVATGATPLANFELHNATFIGAGTNVTGNRALLIREFAAPKVYNSIFTEFGSGGISIDAKSAAHLTNGVLDLRNNIFFRIGGATVGENATAQLLFTDLVRSNLVIDPQLRSISRTNNNRLDPRPSASSAALVNIRTAPTDGFFSAVAFKGAFGGDNWAVNWTALGELGIMSGSGNVPNPLQQTPATPQPTSVRLEVRVQSQGFVVAFPSTLGARYRLQFSTDLSIWTNETAVLIGTGNELTVNLAPTLEKMFFRVLSETAP